MMHDRPFGMKRNGEMSQIVIKLLLLGLFDLQLSANCEVEGEIKY